MSIILDLPTDPAEKDARRRAREAKRLEEMSGRMEPELRYRVLLAMLKMETDFLDLADKKARFALVIMSALNAVALVLVMRGGPDLAADDVFGKLLRAEVALYFAATIYYIWQAIEALRPRGQRGRLSTHLPTDVVPEESMRILFHVDIAAREREANREIWSELRLDNVTTELADQLHMVSRINVLKYDALGRLYTGVGVITVLLTVALVTEAAKRVLT